MDLPTSSSKIVPQTQAQAVALLGAVIGHATDVAGYIEAVSILHNGVAGLTRLLAIQASIQTNANETLATFGTAYVAPRDTFASVATRSVVSGVTANDVARMNGMTVDAPLPLGDLLILPTAVFNSFPSSASSSSQYVYDVVSGRTIASPNPGGFGSVTLINSQTGAYVGEVDLINGPQITSNGGGLSIALSSGRSITVNPDGSLLVNNQGVITSYGSGSSISISANGNTQIKTSAGTTWTQLFAAASDPYVSPAGAGIATASVDNGSYLTTFLSQIGSSIDVSQLTQIGASYVSTDDQGYQFLVGTYSGLINGLQVTLAIEAPLTAGASGKVVVIREQFGTGYSETYSVNPDGTFKAPSIDFFADSNDFVPANGASPIADTLKQDINTSIGVDAPAQATTETSIASVNVINFGTIPQGQLPFTVDPIGPVAGGQVIASPDIQVIDPIINTDGVFSNSPGGILSGYDRPGNQTLSDPSQNLNDLLGSFDGSPAPIDTPALDAPLGDYSTEDNSFLNIDPLVLDLDGAGIGLSNWIGNSVYFDTNVNAAGQADGMLHHTSWVNATDGILAFDPAHAGHITDITQTVSEFFRGGIYADGFSALASLAQYGATVFSPTTSLTDPATGKSYWSELVVWQDTNQDGVSQASELHSLDSLGIASINLVASPNAGESINGSAVTGRATYTTTSGTVSDIASIDLQTDTTGDVTTSADGGVVITSTPEGGASASNSFVAKNPTAHRYVLNNGTLTDQTLSAQVAAGVTGVFSTTQGDTITVGAGDTREYWLGGGTGADTLTGGAGNTVFLVNAKTTVHGGTGFNIAQVNDAAPVNIDLMKDNLQEVIGGAGGGVFNASGTSWNVFIQGGSGNNIIIGGAAHDALSGGTGDDLIEAGNGGAVIHAGSGNDVIYGGSGQIVTPIDPLYQVVPPNILAQDIQTTNYQPSSLDATANLIIRIFWVVYGRAVDPDSFSHYYIGMTQYGYSTAFVVNDLLSFPEGQNGIYASLSDDGKTRLLFDRGVGRDPSANEYSDFSPAISFGGYSEANAFASVIQDPQCVAHFDNWPVSYSTPQSDAIYAGPGHDTVVVGTNNTRIAAGSGPMTLIGNAQGFSVLALHGSYADYKLTHNSDGTETITDSVANRDGPVTFTNVTALDFNDIAQVQVSSAAGMPVNDSLNTSNTAKVTTDSQGRYIIAASTLLANDIDYAGTPLSISNLLDNAGNLIVPGASGTVNGGVASLSSDGTTITFTPVASFHGVYSFRYQVNGGATVYELGTRNMAEMNATAYLNTPTQPADPLFDSEWFLQSADVLPVWADYTGRGVSVGIFDPSGNVDFGQPDLAANAGQEVKYDGSPGIDALGTHATLIAGVIAASRDGGGAVGVAPDATIGSESLRSSGSSTDQGNLLDWSAYDVVNNSFVTLPPLTPHLLSSSTGSYTELDALKFAADDGRNGLGTAVVVAGGNSRGTGDNTNYNVLSASRYAIVAGGINAPSDLGGLQISGAPFSNPGASILVSAPANQISSTGITYTNEFGQQFGADYQTAGGTSFASPIVSGVVALMLQANPNLGWRDIQQILAYSAREVDPSGSAWAYNGANNWNGGGLHTSEDYGFGEVDGRAAVRLAETWQDTDTSYNEDAIGKANIGSSQIPIGHGVDYDITYSTYNFDVEHAEVTLDLSNVGNCSTRCDR